ELDRVLFVLVAQRLDLGMPEERVVVEPHLGVERDKVAAAGDDQRVDLDERRIELGEGAVERVREIAERPHLSAGKPQPKRVTPPASPRPPAWISALTTQPLPPMRRATPTASSAV